MANMSCSWVQNPLLANYYIELEEVIQGLHHSTIPQIHLLLVGNGPLENMMRQIVKGDQSIKFLSFQNQSSMPVIYRLGDIF